MTTPGKSRDAINTTNDHLVGSNGVGVGITLPPMGFMTKEEAIRMAAWLVVCAQDYEAKRFAEVFDAVCNT